MKCHPVSQIHAEGSNEGLCHGYYLSCLRARSSAGEQNGGQAWAARVWVPQQGLPDAWLTAFPAPSFLPAILALWVTVKLLG